MKLTDFKNINEWDLRGVNNYGSAAMQRKANQKAGNADAGLSTKETLGKNIFVDKFVQKASAGLENAIKSGAIQLTPTQPAQTSQAQQIAQTRQQKQAAAAKAAQAQMKQQPGQPAQPQSSQKLDPTKAAELKGRLKAGAGATSAQSGFKNYVGGSGERMTGVDQSGAPIFKKIQREGKYSQLNSIFESILNEQAPTVSSFVMDAWKAYLHGVNPSAEKSQQAQQLANQVQATYAQDKGQAALRQLGDLAWYASSESVGTPSQPADDDEEEYSGTQQPAAQIAGSGNMRQVYSQVNKLLQSLSKQERAQVLSALQAAEEKANI